MDEMDIYKAFGLDEPGDDEGAEPGQDGAEGGEPEDIEPGEPEESGETGDGGQPEPEEPEDQDESAEKPAEPEERAPMDKAERARQAAARRAREREADIQAALERGRQEERRRVDELLKASGMKNPLDRNASIEDLDGFERYVNQAKGARDELRDRRVSNGSGSAEDIREIVAEAIERHPALIHAREMEEQAAREQQRATMERVKAKAEAQIREIAESYDPGIQSLEDILAMDTAESFKSYVAKGLSFVEAYRLANYDTIADRKTAEGKAEAARLASSKRHLQSSKSRGAGGVEVPAGVKAMYRKFMPNITDKEIAAHYARQGRK